MNITISLYRASCHKLSQTGNNRRKLAHTFTNLFCISAHCKPANPDRISIFRRRHFIDSRSTLLYDISVKTMISITIDKIITSALVFVFLFSGFEAAHVNDANSAKKAVTKKSVTHIFISPECLTSHLKPLLIGMEDKTRFSLLFVDESHCIVKWFVHEFPALILILVSMVKKCHIFSEAFLNTREGNGSFYCCPYRGYCFVFCVVVYTPKITLTYNCHISFTFFLFRGQSDKKTAAFRKAYNSIGSIRAVIPEATCVALTATATTEVVAKVKESLHMKSEALVRISPEKPNIR